MIIQIGTEVDESRILWKYKESDEWKKADIDDLICAYENKPKGEWVDDCTCSNCNWLNEDDDGHILLTAYNYCPNCGADMRGKK